MTTVLLTIKRNIMDEAGFTMNSTMAALLVIALGVVLLLGSILKWKWVLQTQGDRPMGFLHWMYSLFGEKGYRIAMGFLSVMIILCGIAFLLLW